MRITAICREAWRDIITGTTGTVVFGTLLSIIIAGLTFLDLTTITGLNHQAQQYRSSMASVTVLQAPGRIDGAACEALNQLPGAQAAAVRPALEPLVAAHLPGTTMQTYEATPSIGHVLRATPGSPGGIYLSRTVADQLALDETSTINLTTAAVPVTGIFEWDETDGRPPGYGYSSFVPTATQRPFDECWLDTWPINPRAQADLNYALLPAADEDQPATKSFQLNTTHGATFDGPKLFDQRPTRYVPVPIAILSFALGFLAVRRRKLEIASDLHAGVPRADLTLKHLLETASWASVALIATTPAAALLITANHPTDTTSLLALAITHLATGLTSTFLGGLVALTLTRESHLNRYFKTR
ncbi:MAG: hypothetical protein Q4G35_02390 [Propionibacteriaceae bacterium]|nr:hypothetical protein [Propionibacteriaceae bacterium]